MASSVIINPWRDDYNQPDREPAYFQYCLWSSQRLPIACWWSMRRTNWPSNVSYYCVVDTDMLLSQAQYGRLRNLKLFPIGRAA